MERVIVHYIDENVVGIETDNVTLDSAIYNKFSFQVPGYLFAPQYKAGRWDGKVHFYNKGKHLLPYGLKGELKRFCSILGAEYLEEGFGHLAEVDEQALRDTISKWNSLTLRDYQFNALKSAIGAKRAIVEAGTGSGKTLIIYNYIRTLLEEGLKKILVIVPNIILVDQMLEDEFIPKYGWPDASETCEMLHGGLHPTFKKPVLISTWQSLVDKDSDFFEEFDAVIVDEVHKAKANELKAIMTLCKNAQYRLGTTGTMPESKDEYFQVVSLFGDVCYQIRAKDLIQAGVLAEIEIASIFMKYPDEFIRLHRDRSYPEEVKMTEEYGNRNDVGLRFIIDNIPKNHNVLIMFRHIKHIEATKKWIDETYPDRKCAIITGSVAGNERSQIKHEIEDEDGTLLLATYDTMSTGVNIKKLHTLIFWASAKSKITILQSIGRILRKMENKEKVILFDAIDDLSYKSKNGRRKKNKILEQYSERKRHYVSSEFPVKEFTINI